jgi:hypothetical protein
MTAEVVVYAVQSRAATVQTLLSSACAAVGASARLELFGSGSLFQRLRARRSPPPPDLLLWFGPYAAHAAALEGLLQPYQPANLPRREMHDASWRWVAVEFQPFHVTGDPLPATLQDLATVRRLALADPERSEVGLAVVLAVLDGARQTQGDIEPGWLWWQHRMQSGAFLADDDGQALDTQRDTGASHALTLGQGAAPVSGLAPLPHAIALSSTARNSDGARQLFDWLVGPDAVAPEGLSAWQAETNGLAQLLDAAPPLDVDWATRQYSAVRRRWAESHFGPTLG